MPRLELRPQGDGKHQLILCYQFSRDVPVAELSFPERKKAEVEANIRDVNQTLNAQFFRSTDTLLRNIHIQRIWGNNVKTLTFLASGETTYYQAFTETEDLHTVTLTSPLQSIWNNTFER
jgi:hypothetical protein